MGFIFTHGWLSHSMSLGGSPNALTYSLTDSILILFIKQFSLHPLLSIAFVQECSVVFRKVFWQGKTRKVYILPSKWRAWKEFVKHFQRLKSAILVLCVFLSFFGLLTLLTHRWKLVEVYDCGHDELVTTARSASSTKTKPVSEIVFSRWGN